MQKTAVVCVTNDLSTDQRVHKTCLSLYNQGYTVIEWGILKSNSLPLNRIYSTKRNKLWNKNGPLFYAEFNIRLFLFLLFARVDLIFSNDLDTLPACFLAAKIRKKRIIYDTHEYFTEMPELVNRPATQKIWQKIENFIFPKLTDIITVNHSIAKLYSEKFNKKVLVSRNIPPTYQPQIIKSRQELELPIDKKIIILQGSGINIQRGAEEAVLAMEFLENVVLLVVGNGDVLPILKTMVEEKNLYKKVIFRPKMSFEDLRQYTINSDLGLAIDKDTNLNYHFSLPNKLFDYIHAEIPVLSSKLVELVQIIEEYNIGYFIENHEPQHIAEVIQDVFKNDKLYQIKKKNTVKAKNELCWEIEEKVLLSVIKKQY